MFSAGGTPCRIFDSEQPHLPERLNDAASLRLCGLSSVSRHKSVEVPERLRAGQVTDWIIRKYPASNILRPLAHGTACAARNRLAIRLCTEDHNEAVERETSDSIHKLPPSFQPFYPKKNNTGSALSATESASIVRHCCSLGAS
jgi:hypothetical protein